MFNVFLLTYPLHFLIKHLYPVGSGLYQDYLALINSTQWLTARFNEKNNYVNHILRPSQSSDLNSTEHLWVLGVTCLEGHLSTVLATSRTNAKVH